MPARKKFEEIAEHVELQIFSGRIKEGDKLPSERELMERFGAGRSSVREALFALQRRGLVAARAGTAARVTRPSAESLVGDLSGSVRHLLARPEGIRDLQDARTLLEVGLARTAALKADDEDIARIAAALDANRRAADQDSFARTDMAFHEAIARVSRNGIFAALGLALNEWLAEQRRVSARSGVGFEDVARQHAAIFEAIRARDAAAAQDAMTSHLEAVAQNYWSEALGR